MLVSCSGDSEGEEAEQGRDDERFCFEGRQVSSSSLSLNGLGYHVPHICDAGVFSMYNKYF